MPNPPRPRPARIAFEGHHCRLEPLAQVHAEALFAASSGPGTAERFAFLFDEPPVDLKAMTSWIAQREVQEDPLFHAIIDRRSGRAEGRQALMRVTPEHGVIEVGSILFGPSIARTAIGTEAIFLLARYVFDELGYRRFEWKCHNDNAASKRAALRFGFEFEGVFRQHMWIKGASRDTAWFAMLDREWPKLRPEYERWLAPTNFTPDGVQRTSLRVRL